MITKVPDNGLLIPKQWLEGVEQVEIRREADMIKIVPIKSPDPILDLGKQPITADVNDASIHHDRYLYKR